MSFQKVLRLKDGETIANQRSITTGFMGQIDQDTYDVLDAAGLKVGSVVYTDETAVKKPFRRSQRVVQRDLAGAILVDVFL